MAYYTWPDPATDSAFTVDSMTPRIRTVSDESVSPMNGDIQTSSLPGTRWSWTIAVPEQTRTERRRLWAFLTSLNGREHRLRLHDMAAPTPEGTIPTSGVTVLTAATQFATSITLATGVAGCTVKRGDWLKLLNTDAGQLVLAVDDATANGSGQVTVNFRHMLRKAVAAGASVGLVRPTGLFVLAEPDLTGGRLAGGAFCDAFTFDVVEVFQ